jgi:hypothetical protein
MFINFWNQISAIGLKIDNNEELNKKITLLNRINVMACIVYLVIGLIYFTFNDNFTALFIGLLFILNIVAFYLQSKHYSTASLSLVMISSYLSIFYFDSYSGFDSGAFLYFVPIVMSLLFLFNIKTDRNVLFAHLLLISALFFTNIITGHELFKSDIMTNTMRSNLLIANITMSLLSVIYFLYLLSLKKGVKTV